MARTDRIFLCEWRLRNLNNQCLKQPEHLREHRNDPKRSSGQQVEFRSTLTSMTIILGLFLCAEVVIQSQGVGCFLYLRQWAGVVSKGGEGCRPQRTSDRLGVGAETHNRLTFTVSHHQHCENQSGFSSCIVLSTQQLKPRSRTFILPGSYFPLFRLLSIV